MIESLENRNNFVLMKRKEKKKRIVRLYHNTNLGSVPFKMWKVLKNMTVDNIIAILTTYV